MNETATILVLSIVGVWFFTSPRFQAVKTVLTYKPSTSDIQTPTQSPGGYTPDEIQKGEDLEKQFQNGISGGRAVV